LGARLDGNCHLGTTAKSLPECDAEGNTRNRLRLTFTHGGSRAKGTMIRDDYDLDEVCYLENDDDAAGATLEDIYENVAAAVESEYRVRRKRSSLRLLDKKGRDLKIDLVPGRYTDSTKTDVFLRRGRQGAAEDESRDPHQPRPLQRLHRCHPGWKTLAHPEGH
jgi:hypothetical protein